VWVTTLIGQGQRIADELSGSGPQVAT
jgi:hypothetical protein